MIALPLGSDQKEWLANFIGAAKSMQPILLPHICFDDRRCGNYAEPACRKTLHQCAVVEAPYDARRDCMLRKPQFERLPEMRICGPRQKWRAIQRLWKSAVKFGRQASRRQKYRPRTH